MSTQVPSNRCLPEFAPRPDMERYHSTSTAFVNPHMLHRQPELCNVDKPKSRRHDGLIASFKSDEWPRVSSSRIEAHSGLIKKGHIQAYDPIHTELGTVLFPVEPTQEQFMPSVSQLNFLMHSTGTRRQPRSDRFFP